MLSLSTWKTPATSYPNSQVGRARIKTIPCKRGYYEAYGLHGVRVYRATKPLPIQTLQIDGKTWMVDDPPHWWAMQASACTLGARATTRWRPMCACICATQLMN